MLVLGFYYSTVVKYLYQPPTTINSSLYKSALTVSVLCLFHPLCIITSQILDEEFVGTCLNHATSFPKQEKVEVRQSKGKFIKELLR